MVSVGAKALLNRQPRSIGVGGDNLIYLEHGASEGGKRMKAARRKTRKAEASGSVSTDSRKFSSNVNSEYKKFSSSNHQNGFNQGVPAIRKQVDPDRVKYFTEISNVLDNDNLELEERQIICANALEEAQGKELELATDYILSHTLETLLEGCCFENLCSFLRGCANVFPLMAMDRSGSHVAESALKALVPYLEDGNACRVIENTLETICKAVATSPTEMMCNSYGSHFLRSLLCLFGGIPTDSPEVHGVKRSSTLPEGHFLNVDKKDKQHIKHKFPTLLRFLVWGMLNVSKKDLKILQIDPYGSLVLQTALKLLEGHDEELQKIIPILFGCGKDVSEGYFGELSVSHAVKLLKQTAFSHLVEVVLEVIPETLFDELLRKVVKGSLLELSYDQCGNFVVQKLISRARNENQFELIWQELGTKFNDILDSGKSGVIASLAAASDRLETKQYECAQSLATAVCSTDEDARSIVPRILSLDSYFASNDRSNWSWPQKTKIHAMGSLILQTVFRFQSDVIQNYVSSILSMETHQTVEIARDSRGARVIEAFLGGNASMKLKRRFIMKLRGHFGELAMHPSGSFTVEKCFSIGNLSLKEVIATDVLEAKADLAKTKQGPYILRTMDIDCFAGKREQWRLKQESKQSTYEEFFVAFGSKESQPSKKDSFLRQGKVKNPHHNDMKRMRDEIEHDLAPRKRSSIKDQSVAAKNPMEGKERKPFLSFDMKKRSKDEPSMKHSRKKRKP